MFALGNLSKLILDSGKEVSFTEADNLLVWDEGSQNLLITKPLYGRKKVAQASDYHEFHARNPTVSMQVEWFKPRQVMENLGLVSAIHYYVPAYFSSTKKDKEYKHFFGDYGGEHWKHGIEHMPALIRHPVRGTYYLRRRPTNGYSVDEYIRG